MGDALIAPLLLTDRPWAEIEAQKGAPVSTNPLFGGIVLQEITLPIVVSREMWEMLSQSLRRRYEKAPPPAPVLMLEGPRWWEKEQEKSRLLPKAVMGHSAVVDQIKNAESNNRKLLERHLKGWIKTLAVFADKHPDAKPYYKKRIGRIKEYMALDMYTQAQKQVKETNVVFLAHTALDVEIMKLLKETDDLNNEHLRENILEGNNFVGINAIAGKLDENPEDSLEIRSLLNVVRGKLDDYRSRPSNLKSGLKVKPKGPNGLFSLVRGELDGRPTGRLYRSETKAAQTVSRIRDIDYLITNERLRANRDGPNPGYWHAHVGQDYRDNMIVRKSDLVIMGFVDGHISTKKEDRANATRASEIESRNTQGQLVEILVIDDDLYEVV